MKKITKKEATKATLEKLNCAKVVDINIFQDGKYATVIAIENHIPWKVCFARRKDGSLDCFEWEILHTH